MILLAVTLAQWAAGWLVLGRLGRCDLGVVYASSSQSEVGAEKDRPHPSPLPRGERETVSASWPNHGSDLALVQGVHARRPLGNLAPVPTEQLSIIIPARNEEENLPRLLGSLLAQPIRPAEIIVVDDGSTDRTAEVARQQGARLLVSQALPAGWRGKTWACHQGAQVAVGQWFLFLDADTRFEPDGLARALAEFPAAGGGALAVVPYHAVRDFHEQFSAFFNLAMLAATGAFTLLGDGYRQRGLPGQFLLMDRATYQQVGGHESVKGRILENFWLSKQLQSLQVPMRCCSGRGIISFSMYPEGWRQLVEGWTKGFASGAGLTPLPLLLLLIAWLGGLAFAPIGVFGCGAPWLWLAVYGLCAVQVGWLLRRAGSFHWSGALVYPALLAFFFAVFARSVWRSGKTVSWKGREIRAD